MFEARPKVLAVDDNLDDLETLTAFLVHWGYDPTPVANPVRARGKFLQDESLKIIVMNYELSEAEGITNGMALAVRLMALRSGTQAIMLTKGEFRSLMPVAERAGIRKVLLKTNRHWLREELIAAEIAVEISGI